MAGYAIFRVEGKFKEGGALRGKHSKNLGDLKRQAAHIQRNGSMVSNAAFPYDSRHVTGNPDLVAGVMSCMPEKKKLDSVMALEVLLTTSPESLRVNDEKNGALDPKKVKMFVSAADEFIKRWGGCVHMFAHFDERTPHYQGFIVPNAGFVPGAPLNAKKELGPQVLERYQTEWAEMLQKHGLDVKRGEPGSQAEHEPIKDYYSRVNSPLPTLPPAPKPVPKASAKEKILESAGIETERSKAEKKYKEEQIERQRAKENQRIGAIKKLQELELQNEQLTKRIRKAESRLSDYKADAAQLRDISLERVMRAMGAEKHARDPQRWETGAGSIWLEKADGGRFNSFDDPDLKGRGAIDLVIRVQGMDYKKALSWLAENFGDAAAASELATKIVFDVKKTVSNAVKDEQSPTLVPTPSQSHWDAVKGYLVAARKLPGVLVDQLHEAGRIYADKFKNAVFLTDKKTGCEVRGTVKRKPSQDGTERPAWHQHIGEKTGFTVAGDQKHVAIVESSIEAISLHAINGFTCVSVGGTNPKRSAELASLYREKGARVYAAQNADIAGDKQAAKLMQDTKGVERLAPPFGMDWNDVLKRDSSESQNIKINQKLSAKPN